MKLVKRTLLIAPVLLSCVGCDQVTKNIARQGLANSEPIAFLNDIFRLQYAENPGAFLSLGAGSSENIRFWVFTLIVGVFLAGMLVYLLVSPNNSKAKMISLSLVIGGGVGNLIDRVLNEGRVIDFMNIGIGSLRTGVFNVADIAISFGVVWLCAISLGNDKNNRGSFMNSPVS
ncbi:MAG TPA: signal peptidase II [Desulfuromonadaceae bacterium]|jgi:signal peptidase II